MAKSSLPSRAPMPISTALVNIHIRLAQLVSNNNSNQQQPTTTNSNQQQPTTTNNNQQQPTTTDNNRQQPTTTDNNRQQPTTTNHKQQPTNNQTTTNNNQQQPTTTTNNNSQQQPTTANSSHDHDNHSNQASIPSVPISCVFAPFSMDLSEQPGLLSVASSDAHGGDMNSSRSLRPWPRRCTTPHEDRRRPGPGRRRAS